MLVLINTDVDHPRSLVLNQETVALCRRPPQATGAPAPQAARLPVLSQWSNLLGQPLPAITAAPDAGLVVAMPAGAAFCLAPFPTPRGLCGEVYRRARARAAWALTAMNQVLPVESTEDLSWRTLAAAVDRSPADFLAALSQLAREAAVEPPAHPTLDVSLVEDLARGVRAPARWEPVFPNVVLWDLGDVRRITAVPPGHWLLVHDTSPFRATLEFRDGSLASNVELTQAGDGHMACFAPSASSLSADADLRLERYAVAPRQVEAAIRFLAPFPSLPLSFLSPSCPLPSPLSVRPTDLDR